MSTLQSTKDTSTTHLNHQNFIDTLVSLKLDPRLIRAVDYTYELAKAAHRGQNRDGIRPGDSAPRRYFEHVREVALALINENKSEFLKLSNNSQARLLMAALMHDVLEDTSLIGSPKITLPGNLSRRQIAAERLASFEPNLIAPDSVTANDKNAYNLLTTIVLAVTKFDLQELNAIGIFKDRPNYKKLKLALSASNIDLAGPAAVLIKAADRLCNLKDMQSMDSAFQNKKIKETEEFFMPLFKKYSNEKFGQEYTKLIKHFTRKIDQEMSRYNLQASFVQ